MRVFLGMILGAALTVSAAFLYDNLGGSAGSANAAAGEHRKMVNWDVVNDNWRSVRQRAREAWTTLSHKVSS